MSISLSLTMPSSSQPAHLPRTARNSVAAVAALLVGLAAASRPAAAQAVAQGAARQSGAMICDPVTAPAPAAAPVAARPATRHVAPKAVAAGSHTVKKPAVVAATPRKSAPRAAGHRRAVAVPVAKAAPAPQCRKAPEPALAAADPTPVGVSNLVNSLPWTAPATVAVLPTATAPVWDEVAAPIDSSSSRSFLRPAAIGAGLLGGAVALLASNHGNDRSTSPISNGTQPPPVITPGTPGSPDIPGGPVTTVPEPGTMVLVGTGIAALVARKRRRRGE